MKPATILIILMSLGLLALGCTRTRTDLQLELRPELEKAWEDYQSAVTSKDAEKFKASLATFRYASGE